MTRLSDLMIGHPELSSFGQLERLVAQLARNGEIHLYFDVKPEFPDTPRQWESRLELSFYAAQGEQT